MWVIFAHPDPDLADQNNCGFMRIRIHNTAANIIRVLFPNNYKTGKTGKSMSAGARDFLTSFNLELRTLRRFQIYCTITAISYYYVERS